MGRRWLRQYFGIAVLVMGSCYPSFVRAALLSVVTMPGYSPALSVTDGADLPGNGVSSLSTPVLVDELQFQQPAVLNAPGSALSVVGGINADLTGSVTGQLNGSLGSADPAPATVTTLHAIGTAQLDSTLSVFGPTVLANLASGGVLHATSGTGLLTVSSVVSSDIADGTIVNADVSSTAAIGYGKLNLANAIVAADLTTGAVTSAKILDGEITNADISSSGAIADSKLATISTAGKVANSATTATSSNTTSAIVVRDSSGNFSASTITATLTGNVTGNLTGNVTGNATTVTSGVYTTDTGTVTGTMILDGSIGSVDLASSLSLTSPTITGSPTASGATWANLGTVTTVAINGGTINGTTIGGSSPAAGTFTTLSGTGAVTLGAVGGSTTTTFYGPIDVRNDANDTTTISFNNEGDLTVNGGIVADHLNVSNNSTVNGNSYTGGNITSVGTLTVGGSTTLQGVLQVQAGELYDPTNLFIVDGAGNTMAAGYLVSGGNLTSNGTLMVSGVTTLMSTLATGNITAYSSGLNANLSVISKGTGSLTLDSASSGAVNIGTANDETFTKDINIGALEYSHDVNIKASHGVFIDTNHGDFSVETKTGVISIGQDDYDKAIFLGSATGSSQIFLNAGSGGVYLTGPALFTGAVTLNSTLMSYGSITGVAGATILGGAISLSSGSSALSLNASSTGTINMGTGAQARSINIGTGTASQAVTIGSTSDASPLILRAGSSGMTLTGATSLSSLGNGVLHTTGGTGLLAASGVVSVDITDSTITTDDIANYTIQAEDTIGTTGTGQFVLSLSPTIVTPTIEDEDSGILLTFSSNPGVSAGNLAMNNLEAINAQSDSSPALAAVGMDTNIDLRLRSKGTGDLVFQTPTATDDSLRIDVSNSGVTSYAGTLTVADLTAVRTWTLPNVTGTLVTTGDSGTVTSALVADNTIINADVSSSAAIAYAKLDLAGSLTASDLASTTGSGAVVLATSPTLVTPILGVATATTLNGLTITPTTGTLTVTNGKTLAVSNTLTLAAGADGQTFTFPSSSTTVAGLGTSQTFSGVNTFSGQTKFSGSRVLASSGNTLTDGATLTAAKIGGHFVTADTSGGTITVTADSATNIIASISGAQVGDIIPLLVVNTGANNLNIEGSGTTYSPMIGTITIPARTTQMIYFRIEIIGDPLVFIY